eukprot:5079275-Prymnesium_polylepis.1
MSEPIAVKVMGAEGVPLATIRPPCFTTIAGTDCPSTAVWSAFTVTPDSIVSVKPAGTVTRQARM